MGTRVGGAARRNAVVALLAVTAAALAGAPAAPVPASASPARAASPAASGGAPRGPASGATAAPGSATPDGGSAGPLTPWLSSAQLQPDEGGAAEAPSQAVPSSGEEPAGTPPATAPPGSTGTGGSGTDGSRTGGGPAGSGTDSQVDAARPVWTPPGPLPAAASGSRPVDVVLSPHPDDETLSLGVWVADATARGDRVIVVALSDGRSTGAITKVSARLGRPVTRDRIAAARLRELDDAARRLGVRPGDVYAAHLDSDDSDGGSRVTQPEVMAVIRAFAARFPAATFATMSWAAERHPDHLDAGRALREAATTGVVARAVFAVSRLWWSLPSPPARDLLPTSQAVRRRVLAAADAYDRWDPADDRLAIGWTSVRSQFTALVADPRNRVHD